MFQRISAFFCAVVVLGSLAGCGGIGHQSNFQGTGSSTNSGNASSPSSAVSVTLLPASATVFAGESVSFSSPYVGNVVWKVNGIPGGESVHGTIDGSGNYTAPSAAPPDGVTVTAQLGNFGSSPSVSAAVMVLNSGTVTPTGNPLVAAYTLTIPDKSTVTVNFGPDAGYGLQTSALAAPAGGGPVRILVAGMTASSTYHMRAAVQLSGASVIYDVDHLFTTGSLPSTMGFPAIKTQTFPGQGASAGVELLSLTTPKQVALVATDLSGNYIWYYNTSANLGYVNQPAKILPSGHLLTQFNDYNVAVADGAGSVIREIDLEGNTIWQMTAADLNTALSAAGFNITVIGTHHDLAILPNGHIILLAAVTKEFDNLVGLPGTTIVTGDVVIDLDQSRKPVWVWSTFDHFDINRHPIFFPDWTHTNAVLYSPDDGNLVLSVRHQDWIVKIDYRNGTGTGDVLWRLGCQGDFQLIGGVDPVDWFYAQHAPHFVSTETAGAFDLLLFDNGNNRVLDSAGDICGTTVACETTVPFIHVDEQQKTATILWRDRLGVFSNFGGYVQNLANSDIEFSESAPNRPAISSTVQEVTNSTPPEPVWQMQINGAQAYRALRIPSLYPGVTWP